jgi:anti-sigma factor RsiW
MKHCLSPEIWTGFLDGSLSTGEETRAEKHLAICSHCHFLAGELVRVEEVLTGVARESKDRVAMAPKEIRMALNRFQSHMRAPRGIACCLDALRFFLNGMLGSSAGGKVLRSAARQVEVTEAGWPDFIARLSNMIGDLCGEGAGAVVAYIGKLAEPGLA